MKLKNSPWKNNETKKNCNKKIEVLSLKKNEKGENLLHVTTINHSFKKAQIDFFLKKILVDMYILTEGQKFDWQMHFLID